MRELLRRVRAGEDAAFAELFSRHAGVARGFALRYATDAAEADDIAAEAFFRVLQAVRRGAGTRGQRARLPVDGGAQAGRGVADAAQGRAGRGRGAEPPGRSGRRPGGYARRGASDRARVHEFAAALAAGALAGRGGGRAASGGRAPLRVESECDGGVGAPGAGGPAGGVSAGARAVRDRVERVPGGGGQAGRLHGWAGPGVRGAADRGAPGDVFLVSRGACRTGGCVRRAAAVRGFAAWADASPPRSGTGWAASRWRWPGRRPRSGSGSSWRSRRCRW